MKTISFVIPCHNEERNIPILYREILRIINPFRKYLFEFVFVDNGSTDDTKKEILRLSRKDKRVIGIFLTRDFGPESSAQAGYEHTRGDAVIGIACDLQEPPELITQFIRKWEEGYKNVLGIYTKVEDYPLLTILRKIFYKIFKSVANISVPVNTSGYGLMDRQVLDTLISFPEKYRFLRGLNAWTGFKTAYITYERGKRKYGSSSYRLYDYLKHAERGVFGFSYLILDLMVYLGFILVILSFLFIFIYILITLILKLTPSLTLTVVSAIIFFGGLQLLAISIIGKYIQIIVEETKRRPNYIVEETVNYKSEVRNKN